MEFAKINKNRLIEAYTVDKKSTYEIAEEFGTHSSKIRRALTFLGVERRKASEAQSNTIRRGRSNHPTKGKKFTKEQRDRLSEAKSKSWAEMSPEAKERFAQVSKDKWDAMSESDRQDLRQMAFEAIRQSSQIGSKTERYVKAGLEEKGYYVVHHAKNIIPSEKLEVDFYIPDYKVAIEIDGPSHFLPIWGEEKLKKQQSADIIKQGLLLSAGIVILRIRQIDKTMSLKRMRDVLNLIVEELEKVEKKFPGPNNRLIELEVKDGITRRCS